MPTIDEQLSMSTLTELKALPDAEFNEFFAWCPPRVQLLVRGKMCAWQDVLPQWYEKYKEEKKI